MRSLRCEAPIPPRVESALKDLGGSRRWLAPLVYAAGTVAVVFDGVLLLLHNWRLTLLQLFPAVWIWVMTWNMRTTCSPKPTFSTSARSRPQSACCSRLRSPTGATRPSPTRWRRRTTDIRAAFGEARPHWRLIGGLALLTGGVQALIWLLVPRLDAELALDRPTS